MLRSLQALRASAGGLVSAVALATALAAGTAGAQENSVRIAVQENPLVLDPVMIQRNTAYRVLPNIFDTLIKVDYQEGQQLVPGLATGWRYLDPTTLELTLRRGVTFHDGTAFTSEDVAFSLGEERLGEGKPGHGAYKGFLSTIASVEAVDDFTVRVTTFAPDPVLELRLSGWGAQIVSKDAFEALGGDWSRWSVGPVGSGPFRVERFVPGEALVLSAFDGYWGDAPSVDEVRFLDVPEVSTRIAGLVAGDYHIIAEVNPDQIETIESHKGLRVAGGTIRNHRILTYDFDNELLRDIRIRKALSLAIDRQLLVDTIWQGRVEITNGLQWPEFGPLYDPTREPPVYDPEAARKLLEEAGYDGEVIPYRIRNNYYPSEIMESEAVAAMWRAVGFNIDLQIKESWDQVFAEPGTGIRNGSAPPLFADPISGLWRNYGREGGDEHREKWSNAEFNALGKTLLQETDVAKRAAAHAKMLEIWHEQDPPSTILHALGQFYGLRQGIEWTPYNVAFMDLGAGNLSFVGTN